MAALAAATLATVSCYGQSFLYGVPQNFGGRVAGTEPEAPPVFDAFGNIFGTTEYGGANGFGTAWEITAAGAFEDLHDFGGTVTNANGKAGPDGQQPLDVLIDPSGNLFGVAFVGGANYNQSINPVNEGGMLWEITTGGSYKDLHDFGGTVTNANGESGRDGQQPSGSIYRDSTGDLFGVALFFGANATTSGSGDAGGVLWEFTQGGQYKDLHDFGGTVTTAGGTTGPDGQQPRGGVSADASGNLLGTADSGGPNAGGPGMVWELTTGGAYKDLHDFGGTIVDASGFSSADGSTPLSTVVVDASGDIYGTADQGGPNNLGMLWEITAAGSYVDLHDFGGTTINANGSSGPDGKFPFGAMAIDTQGDLYGVTEEGGEGTFGMVFEYTASGHYSDLHDFGGTVLTSNGSQPDGKNPFGGLILDASGNLWGTCVVGGTNGDGVLWAMRLVKAQTLTLSPSTIGGIGASTGTITLANPASTGGLVVSLHAGASGYLNLPSSVTVAANATTATFTITGTAQRSATVNMGIFASSTVGSSEAILTIQGDKVTGLSFNPSTIGYAGSTTATVTISSAAPPGGWVIYLKGASSGYMNMPASVTVPYGATSTTFTISGASQRTGTVNMGVIASDGNSSVESHLTLQGDALKSISLSPTSMGWSGTSTCTLTLNAAAPLGGWVVKLKAGAPGYLSMPASITIAAGATTGTFSVTGTQQFKTTEIVSVIANDTGTQLEADLTLTGDTLKSISLSPTSIGWAGNSTGTITLNSPAPTGGWVVSLSAGASGYLSLPASVRVAAGATTATFSITGAKQYKQSVTIGVIANDTNTQVEADLTLTGDTLTGLTLSPTSVQPGSSSTGTVTLSGPAPSGGWVVKIWAADPHFITVPATITVPAGSTSASFTITTTTNTSTDSFGIFANDGTAQFEALLEVE